MREYGRRKSSWIRTAVLSLIPTRREIIQTLREIVRAVVALPLAVKVLIGVAVLIEFVVVTQWERLPFRQVHSPVVSKVPVSPPEPEQNSFNFPEVLPADKVMTAAVEAALAKRMARVVIEEPTVQANGIITGGGQTLYLYGIKAFDSKAVCTRASGERWACGLHAYATLRNAIAKKTIVCDPKTLLPNAVSAICHLGTTDIALALVRDGLVEVDDKATDSEMAKAQAFAKNQKIGIWDR